LLGIALTSDLRTVFFATHQMILKWERLSKSWVVGIQKKKQSLCEWWFTDRQADLLIRSGLCGKREENSPANTKSMAWNFELP
jgi:hypothetical protein